MYTTKDRSTLATLQAQRQTLQRELAIVGRQIDEGERAQAQLLERIRILEKGQRQAA